MTSFKDFAPPCPTSNRIAALKTANACNAYANRAAAGGFTGIAAAANRAAAAAYRQAVVYAADADNAVLRKAERDYQDAYVGIAVAYTDAAKAYPTLADNNAVVAIFKIAKTAAA